MLVDEGTYIASESSFNRVLRAHGQTRHRGRTKAPQRKRPPSTHVATAPRQLWCWDMTFLASRIKGQWFYLYLILDVYSRKIVGFEVHESDSSITRSSFCVERRWLKAFMHWRRSPCSTVTMARP
jgi:putative transposase